MNKEKIVEKLIELLDFTEATLTEVDEDLLKNTGLESFIYVKLTTQKFRNAALSKKMKRYIRSVIKDSIEQNRAIHITVPFGGYKHYKNKYYPNIGWAEVFNLIHLLDYVKVISKAYKPGIILEYFYDEIFVERLNKIPQKDLDTYNKNFADLCAHYNELTPSHIDIRYSKISDKVGPEVLHTRFDKAIEKLEKEWDDLGEDAKNIRLGKARRNYAFSIEHLSGSQQNEILKEPALIHDAFIFGDWEEGVHWAFENYMIPIGFRYTGEWGIGIYSSKGGSSVQFWVGHGVLQIVEDKVKPHIYTHKQLEQIKSSIESINLDLQYPFPDSIIISH
ncbi:MAG: hypothetical protein Q9M91_00900 [Candidatus Dojkabacteria bacterium]|nr:hypothetical protein [Candidatus Dojkabacteria bacterium]MDQ7020384.1 hypothetical protein [Candidatus Dojkabacteria bacterium]